MEKIIYGAGMVGELLYRNFELYGMEKQVIGFAVSKRQAGQCSYLNIPVYEISELMEYRDTAEVIIAAFPGIQDDMENNLICLGFMNYRKVTQEMYHRMTQEYIEDFKKTHPIVDDELDILYFASDNNASSGAFLSMADIVSGIRKAGYRTLIILPEYGNGERILKERGLEYTYVSSNHWAERVDGKLLSWQDSYIADNDKAVEEIADIIEKCHVKLIHNNTSYTYVGAVAADNKNIPVVWHLRENIHEQGYAFKDSMHSYSLINKSKAIITVSEYLKSCYEGLRTDRTHVIYNGIDIENFYMVHDILKDDKPLSIIMVGAITPLKGQEELVEAAKLLKNQDISFHVKFVGNGDYDYINYLRDKVHKYGLDDRITFLGRVDNVSTLYKESDISVVCSRAEAFGRVTVESQLSGCLVIGADAGATRELIEDGKSGYIYERGNYKELASKIKAALKDKRTTVKIACFGQENAKKSFSKENNVNNILEIYNLILCNSEGKRHDVC